jgi:surface antigen
MAHHAGRLTTIAAIGSIALCMPAAAQNWIGLMKNTPAERFNEEDIQLFLDAAKKTLNDTPPGSTVKWENPKTGSRGEMTVVKDFTWHDQPCRHVRVYNESGDRTGTTQPRLCKVDGKWRAVSSAELKR